MSQSVVVAANPLDAGSSPNSVESAADEFTRMLETEANPPRSEPAKARSRRSDPPETPDEGEDDEGHDAAHTDEGHDPETDPLADPILDNPNPGDGEDDENQDGEDDGEDPDADDDKSEDGEDDDGELDLDREVEVTVAGEVKSLPLKEVIAGYSREADYRQKTARLADERREVEEFAEQTVAQRREYDTALDTWMTRIELLRPSQQDWDAIEKTDPATALQMRKQWDALDKQFAEAQKTREKLANDQAELTVTQRNQFVRQENERLFDKVPALRNPKQAKAFRSLIFSYAMKSGYTEQELQQNAVDHRDVLTLYKAARYDEIVAARKGKGQPKPRNEPRPSASSQPRPIGKNRQAATRSSYREASKRLEKSGRIEDAAIAFSEFARS